MKKIVLGFLIFVFLLVGSSAIYFNFTIRPKGKVLSSSDTNFTALINDPYLAFISDRDGNKEVYLANQELSVFIRITQSSQEELLPVYFELSETIAYFSQEGEIYSLWLFTFQQQEKRLLSITRDFPLELKFSPDGRWLTLLEEAAISDDSSFEGGNALFLINTQNGKTERIAKGVTDFLWSPDSNSIIYTQVDPLSIVQTKLFSRSIQENTLSQATELASGIVAPVFLSVPRKILGLDVSDEFLRLVSFTLRGEGQEELFKIKIRPQEKTRYVMYLSPLEDQIILQILSEKVLFESLIISLKDKTVKTLDFEATKLIWKKDGRIIYNLNDQTGNPELWLKENPDAPSFLLTSLGSNWL